MKKYIIKIVALFTVTVTAVSCTDDLTVLPNDRLVIDTYYTTENDFRKGVDYAYDAFKIAGYYSGDNSQAIIPDILSDNLIQNPQGRRSNNSAYIFDIAANVGDVTSAYGGGYAVAARANAVLDKINNLSPGAFRNNIEAEAKAIRAIAHFDIVRRYCKIPTQSADAAGSIGIAYVEIYDPYLVTTRNLNVSQVYDKILNDLLFAEQNISQTASVGKLTKAAIQGMLSRVYLYKGDYDNVICGDKKHWL
ncbi:RagB/SusD family nutrient uptake outer membrane protein [Chryseobacterium arachidis]|uniref:RagB/SusD family nutrient uptake outer membrane protein n=1 Tax=Chryseobacterium arachidis TaxID=1416778 RepID=UPI0036113800